MALMTLVNAGVYPLGKGGIRPVLPPHKATCSICSNNDVPNQYAKFGMCLCFVKGRSESTELVNEAPERPDIRL